MTTAQRPTRQFFVNETEPTRERKYWLSPVEKCDTCDTPIKDEFYDMKTTMGPWGCLCPTCALMGPGIGRVGLGFGQHYKQDPRDPSKPEDQQDLRYYKIAG